ncbi:MAG: AsmA family protein [Burkholderiales bacterium]|nr:AsmA family protein [Burkholderiales bacterium]
MSAARAWRRAGRVAAWIAGSLVVLIVAFILVFDWNWLKSPIESAIARATGRTFEIGGNIDGQWRWHPRVRLERVRLSNPDWAQAPNLFTAEAIDLRIALLPLIVKRIHIYELGLQQPEVNLERLQDGRATWLFETKKERNDGDKGTPPLIDKLRVDRGTLNYADAIAAAQLTAQVQDQPAADDPRSLKFQVDGKLRVQPVKLSGETASLLSLRDPSRRVPIAVRGVLAGTEMQIEGELAGLATTADGRIRYALRAPSLSLLGPVFRVPLPETPAYSVSGWLERAGDRWQTSDLKGKVGKSDVAGTVSVDTGGEKPRIDADLTSSLLDLADLGPLIGGTNRSRLQPTAEDAARLLPNRSFNPDSFGRIDARVVLRAKQVVRAANFPFENFVADFNLNNSQAVIDPLRFGMAGGQLAGKIMLDARARPIHSAVVARMEGVRVAKIAPKQAAVGEAAGVLSGRVDLKGQGNSVAKMLGSSNGRVSVLLAEGNVPGLLPALIDLDGARVLANLVGKNPESVRCAAIDLAVANGVATPNAAVVETDTTVLTLSGQINLGSEALDLKLSQAPKKPSILSLRTPILMTGTLMSPDLLPAPAPLAARGAAAALLGMINPLAALFALIETGPGEDGSCPILQRGFKAKPTTAAKSAAPAS